MSAADPLHLSIKFRSCRFDTKGVKPRDFPERSTLLFGRNNSLSYYDGKYNQITTFTTVGVLVSYAVFDGNIYRTGGQQTDGFAYVREVKVFSQDDNKVKLLSSMSFGRAFH